MKVLADTHALVWALTSPKLLSKEARTAMEEGEIIASVASLWELVLKDGRKGALLDNPIIWWEQEIEGSEIQVLGINVNHVKALAALPARHGDPFDRIMVAQCQVERATLITKDSHLRAYPVPTIW